MLVIKVAILLLIVLFLIGLVIFSGYVERKLKGSNVPFSKIKSRYEGLLRDGKLEEEWDKFDEAVKTLMSRQKNKPAYKMVDFYRKHYNKKRNKRLGRE